ncbi:MAG TPA: hypothetical protein VGZ02_09925 [Candidatus Baltobacteraceae bacterium]|jgi:hypothetical protein|nr:hypothetical protein [Candidatus Baltobacteraceae bacterium]
MKLLARALYGAGLAVTAATFVLCLVLLGHADSPFNKTVYGDLSHLEYTAKGPLSAAFVFPSDGFASPTIAIRFVLSTVRDAGVELQINGEVVPSSKIGKRVVAVKSGLTQYEYYGVVLRPGPNDVVITPLGFNGMRGPSRHATIYGPGPPASLRAELEHPLVADGRTPQGLEVSALDRWGHPAQPGAEVHVSIVDGDARFSQPQHTDIVAQDVAAPPLPSPAPFSSAAPSNLPPSNAQSDPSHLSDVSLDVGGTATLPVLPGMLAGDMRVRLTSGDVEQTETFFIAPYLRKAIVNGLVAVGAGAVPITVDGDGVPDDGAARRGRIALFAQGAVGKRSSLTLAYESQNRLSPVSSYGPYVADPNERPYLTYGDSSTLSSDFHSNTRLFARLDSGRSNVTWGQFNADIVDSSGIGSFHELLGGAKAEYAIPGGNAKGAIFTAHNTTAYVSIAFPASGLSLLAQPLHPDIVVGSDYVTLVALDRHTGAVISQTPLSRNEDYTIDYATGVLRFINVPLPFDDNFNPQSVLVQYAYQGAATASQTTGGDVHLDFGRNQAERLQIGYVNDATGSGNFSLWSQTLSGVVNGGGWTLSHASSHGIAPGIITSTLTGGGGGDALAFAYTRRTGFDQTTLNYTDTSAGFGNPFGGLSVPGFTSYRAAWSHGDAHHDDLTMEVDGQLNHSAGVSDSQRSEMISWRHAVGSAASLLLGIASHTQNNVASTAAATSQGTPAPLPPGASGTIAQAVAGVDVKASSRVSLAVQRTMTLTGNEQNSTQPDETTAQLNYDMDKRGRIFLRELISGEPVASFAQSSSDLTVGAMATRSTAIGIERVVGTGTTISSEYLINQTGNGENIYSALGVQQKMKLSPHVAGNFFLQSANATGTGAGGFTVSGFSLAYTNNDRVRGGLAFQTRGGYGGGDTINAGLAGAISPNVSAVAAVQQATANGVTSADDRFSLAYRPDQNDRFISLLGWDRLSGTGALAIGAATNVVSFEEFWRPGAGVEVAGRAAYKLDGDGAYVAHTSLFGLRVRKNIGKRTDIGAETRTLALPGIGAARSTDFALEGGYRVGEGTRAAVGYSFHGSVDPTLTGQATHRGFYFTLTTLVDRIFGWGNGK